MTRIPYEPEAPGALPKVLVVDDTEMNLRLMRAHLAGEACGVVTCADPRKALDLVAREAPDLVLLDLMMPVMDGFAMLEALREVAPRVPVLVITSLHEREARLRALAAGARDYLTKPVDRAELLIRVRNALALKQASDALAQALARLEAANRDLNAFAGGLAHDLQQPITSIAAFAQVLLSNADRLPSDGANHLRRIVAAAASAQAMIRGLLEFARLGQRPIDRAPVDLNEVVLEARSTLAPAGEGGSANWSVAPLPRVQGDRALLLLALVNLLSNAVKYSRTRARPLIEIEGASDPVQGCHTVRIRDNGVGFDMAHAARLFQPFERLHGAAEFEGTGMGLANVRRIMERHGGSVHCESAPGRGATFTLTFRG